ncbi:PIN domain-containing protein [Candidatus Woesearchaeota archaeon]|nr:PIN domain-containing protein [Candidatus Woesearchaeota archaeon]
MNRFVIDSFAWIEYLDGSEKGNKVAEIVEAKENEIFTSSATVGEIISKVLRGNKNIEIALNHINNLSTVIGITQEMGIAAGHIHFEAKKKNKNFGMLDAFVAATARKIGAKILTGDPDFKNFKEAVMI